MYINIILRIPNWWARELNNLNKWEPKARGTVAPRFLNFFIFSRAGFQPCINPKFCYSYWNFHSRSSSGRTVPNTRLENACRGEIPRHLGFMGVTIEFFNNKKNRNKDLFKRRRRADWTSPGGLGEMIIQVLSTCSVLEQNTQTVINTTSKKTIKPHYLWSTSIEPYIIHSTVSWFAEGTRWGQWDASPWQEASTTATSDQDAKNMYTITFTTLKQTLLMYSRIGYKDKCLK